MTTIGSLLASAQHSWIIETSSNLNQQGNPQAILFPDEYHPITLFGRGNNAGNFFTFARPLNSGYVGYKPASGKKFVCLGYSYQSSAAGGLALLYCGTTDLGFNSASSTGLGTRWFVYETPASGVFVKRPVLFTIRSDEDKYLIGQWNNGTSGSIFMSLFGFEVDSTKE